LTFGEISEISAYKVSIAESGMKNLPERFVVKSTARFVRGINDRSYRYDPFIALEIYVKYIP